MQSITFIRAWRGRAVGQIDSRLTLGVMTTLVQSGTARFNETQTESGQTRQQARQERKRR